MVIIIFASANQIFTVIPSFVEGSPKRGYYKPKTPMLRIVIKKETK